MAESSLDTVRRFYIELFGQGRLELAEEVLAAAYVEHDRIPAGDTGLAGVKEWFKAIDQAFSRRMVVIEDVYVEGDLVHCRWSARATHTGDFMGIPATGRSFDFGGLDSFRVNDGKIIERWTAEFRPTLMQQASTALPRRLLELSVA